MSVYHLCIVHSIKLIAREDQDVIDIRLLQIPKVLADRVRCALIPPFAIESLLSSQKLHETAAIGIEGVGAANVPVEADRVKLGQHVHAIQSAIDAVRQRNINQPILASQRHRRLRTVLRQRIKSCAPSASQYQTDYILHVHPTVADRSC